MDNKTTLQSHNDRLSALVEQVEALPDAGGSGGIIPSGTKTITENGTYDVTNYASAEVDVSQTEMPETVEQATPIIEVSSSGEITATATQTAGYVAAGKKIATKQLTTKGATTVTPSSDEQTVVQAGTYVIGDIKVSAIPSSDGGTGGDTGDLQYCILSNYYYYGGSETPPTLIIYFKPGWTWNDFISSMYNKHIPCEISNDAYRPTSDNTQPSALLEAKSNEVKFSGKNNFLVADWDNLIISTPTDSIIPGKTYYWD